MSKLQFLNDDEKWQWSKWVCEIFIASFTDPRYKTHDDDQHRRCSIQQADELLLARRERELPSASNK